MELPDKGELYRLDTLAEAASAHVGYPYGGMLRSMLVAALENVFDGPDLHVSSVMREMESTGKSPSIILREMTRRRVDKFA